MAKTYLSNIFIIERFGISSIISNKSVSNLKKIEMDIIFAQFGIRIYYTKNSSEQNRIFLSYFPTQQNFFFIHYLKIKRS